MGSGQFCNWHITIQKTLQFGDDSINELQNSLHHLQNLLRSIVLIEGTNSKLIQTHDNCGNRGNIQHQSLVEFRGKEFHNICGEGKCRECLNHECRITPRRSSRKGVCATYTTVTRLERIVVFDATMNFLVSFEF